MSQPHTPRADADGDLSDPLASPFTFADDDRNWQKAIAEIGPARAVELRSQCEARFKEEQGLIVGTSSRRQYDPLLREVIATARPDLAAQAAVQSSDWLRAQFDSLPMPTRSDAHDTVVYRFDSQTGATPMRSYETILQQTGGDAHEARRIFHEETFNSRRPGSTSSGVHSDAREGIDVDAEERQMIARGREAWCQPIGQSNETAQQAYDSTAARLRQVREGVQRADAQDNLRKARADQIRLDANPDPTATAKCRECGETLDAEDVDAGVHPSCATEIARRDMRDRNAKRSRAPFGLSAKMRGFGDTGGNDAA